MSASATTIHSGPVQFPPTSWTVVLEATKDEPELAQKALGELCAHYREAALDFFRIKCRRREDAEDVTGEFIARMLEGKALASFDRQKCPRFRHFLARSLLNCFRDWCDKQKSAKRGGGQADACLSEFMDAGLDAMDDRQIEQAFDLQLVMFVHRRAMIRLESEAGDRARFEALRGFVPFELSHETQEEVAKNLSISIGALRKALFTLRKKYADFFREEIQPMTANPTDAESEFSYLLDLLPEAAALDRQQGRLSSGAAGNAVMEKP